MPKVLDRKSVLFSISQEVLGYEFGTPERVDESTLAVVLPILRHSLTPNRNYVTYPESKELDVHDTGAIDKMQAKNRGSLSVFIRSGTIFKGDTQERASMRSTIVLPGSEVDIPVRCIHASKGISRQAQTKYGSITPLHFDQANYSSSFTAADQHTTWQNVNETVRCMSAALGTPPIARSRRSGRRVDRRYSSPVGALSGQWGDGRTLRGMSAFDMEEEEVATDDLSTSYDKFTKDFDKVLSKVKMVEDQVGLALINEQGCQTVEVFDAQLSWKALHEDAVKRLGPSMANKDTGGVFVYKPERAVEVVRLVLGLDYKENLIYEHKPKDGEPAFTVFGLTAERYTGEVVEFDGRAIHVMLLKMAA